jgi:hypothetical protein
LHGGWKGTQLRAGDTNLTTTPISQSASARRIAPPVPTLHLLAAAAAFLFMAAVVLNLI